MTETNIWTPTDEALTWARSYLDPVQSAAVRLSQHENKGAARIGLRVARYVDLSAARLAMLLDGLNAKQRAALGALPALLHMNSQHLPGYLSAKLPVFGIRGFELNDMVERCGRLALSKELSELNEPVERPLIESVFFSSHVGTLGQRERTEVQVYLAANVRGLGDAPLKRLIARLEDISRWYRHANMVVGFTLLDPVWTAQGNFGVAQGDQAQGVLRLDRFYRDSFLLCGGVPVFWCTAPGTPEDQYAKAAKMIQRVDFERNLSFVDLGMVSLPKPAVRRRAMLGLLNHVSESPLRFMFDLIQLTYGANTSLPLAEHLKLAVFKQGPRSEVVDTFLFDFDCAMVVLKHHRDWVGLDVLRDFIFAKVAIRAHKLTYSHPAFMTELGIARALIEKWGWDVTTLQLADHLDSLNRILNLYIHRRLNEFVIKLYRNISDAAREKKGRFDEEELALLGRRLLAHFAPKSGKVPAHYAYTLHESITRNIVLLTQKPQPDGSNIWLISAGQTSSELGQMSEVWQGKNLLSGLSWIAANHIFRPTTTIQFEGVSNRFGRGFVEDVLVAASKMTSGLDPLVAEASQFGTGAKMTQSMIILNFEELDSPSEENRSGRKHYLPSNWDILNYGREQESRLRDVAILNTDSWDVCTLRRARGKDAIRQALKWVYSGRSYSSGKPQVPTVFAPDGREHRAGQDRLQQLLVKIENLFEQSLRYDECSSFVYEVGNRFQVLQRRGDEIMCFHTNDLSRAMRMATPSNLPIKQLQIDTLAPSLGLIHQLRERGQRDQDVEVFLVWRKGALDNEICVLDASNRIYRLTTHPKRFDTLLVGTIRRLIHHLRDRAHDMRTLRKLLKVYEAKDGATAQTGLQLTDDTVRALRYVGAHPPTTLQVTVGGDLSEGRDGLYYEVGDKRFSASTSGRRFTLECVLYSLELLSKSDDTGFRIEVSKVEFGGNQSSIGAGAVRHLRLMDACQSQLFRTVGHLKAGGKSILNSVNKFGKGERNG